MAGPNPTIAYPPSPDLLPQHEAVQTFASNFAGAGLGRLIVAAGAYLEEGDKCSLNSERGPAASLPMLDTAEAVLAGLHHSTEN